MPMEKKPHLILSYTGFLNPCRNDQSHDSFRNYRHKVFPVSTDDVLDKHLLQDSKEFDVIQVIKHKLAYAKEFYPHIKMLYSDKK